MMKRFLAIAVVLFGTLVLTATANAGAFISGYAGGAMPHDSDWETNSEGGTEQGDIAFNGGFAGGLSAGYWATEMNAPFVGLSLDFNSSWVETDEVKEDGVAGTAKMNGDMVVLATTANLIFRLPTGPVRPYAGGGVGWFYAAIDDGDIDGWSYEGDNDGAFGWQVFGGVSVPITAIHEGFSIFGEYRFAAADFEFDKAGANTLEIDVDYRASQVFGGVSFEF